VRKCVEELRAPTPAAHYELRAGIPPFELSPPSAALSLASDPVDLQRAEAKQQDAGSDGCEVTNEATRSIPPALVIVRCRLCASQDWAPSDIPCFDTCMVSALEGESGCPSSMP
jgi:hypothetical protein